MPDGFMLYGKPGVDFFSTSDFVYPNMKVRLHLCRAQFNFYKVGDKPNVRLECFDCSLCTRHIALKDDCQKKQMDMLAYRPGYNFLESLAKTFIITAR